MFLNTGGTLSSPTRSIPSGRTIAHDGGGSATNSTADDQKHPTVPVAVLTSGDSSYVLTRTLFDLASRAYATINDNTGQTTTAFDGANRPMSTTDALGNVVARKFDGNGNVVFSTRTELSTIDGAAGETFSTAMFYDSLNQVVVLAGKGRTARSTPVCCAAAATPCGASPATPS